LYLFRDDYCMIQPVQKLPFRKLLKSPWKRKEIGGSCSGIQSGTFNSSGNFVMPSEKDVDKFCDDTFNVGLYY
jgi:hypothetical protein